MDCHVNSVDFCKTMDLVWQNMGTETWVEKCCFYGVFLEPDIWLETCLFLVDLTQKQNPSGNLFPKNASEIKKKQRTPLTSNQILLLCILKYHSFNLLYELSSLLLLIIIFIVIIIIIIISFIFPLIIRRIDFVLQTVWTANAGVEWKGEYLGMPSE